MLEVSNSPGWKWGLLTLLRCRSEGSCGPAFGKGFVLQDAPRVPLAQPCRVGLPGTQGVSYSAVHIHHTLT